jgi:hypothetical protein
MRRFTISNPMFLLLLATVTTHADPGDYLEIYAKELKVGGTTAPYSVAEGQPVLLYCDWVVSASNADRQWYANGKEHRFPVRIEVDGVVVGRFEGVLGPRTRVGNADGSRGFAISRTSGPAAWAAKGPGNHKAVCVVNEPKAVSDQWPQNNTTEPVTIKVTSSSPTVKGSLKKPPQTAAPRPAATTPPAAPAAVVTNLVVEAESLIPTAANSGGYMVRQEMAEYGTGWGGNAQLFWRPPTPAGNKPNLLTEFTLPSAGTYELVLYYTKAPDFGQFTVYIDGSMPTNQDGYGPQVTLDQVSLGRHRLSAGRHELAFEVNGKNQRSTGYIIGVDRLQLNSVP